MVESNLCYTNRTNLGSFENSSDSSAVENAKKGYGLS